MKTINNTVTDFVVGNGTQRGRANVANLILMSLDAAPKEGFDVKTIKRRKELESIVKPQVSNENLEFDDTVAKEIRTICESVSWRVRTGLSEFYQEIEKL